MPEFIAQYTPSRASSTVQGFMDAAEWLLPEEDAAKRIRGWSRAAVRTATRICEAFERDNAAAVAEYRQLREAYCDARGWSVDESLGHDLWLTMNGHGTGFQDRGDAQCFADLADAARKLRELDAYRGDHGWLHFS